MALSICLMAGQASADVVLFSDDFNRPDSNTVGNGWMELDAESGAEVGIDSNQLRFVDTSDLNNRPVVYHTFPGAAAGQLTWSFMFDWTRSSSEGTYSVFMQLGSSAAMTDPSTSSPDIPDDGIAVNLVWTVIGGTHEMLAYSLDGTYTPLTQISGLTDIEVVADLVSQTYSIIVDGVMVQGGIQFDNAVSIDTVRYVANQVNENNFSSRNFDDVLITTVDCSGPDNWPPVAYDQDVSIDENTDIDITLTASDCEGSALTFSIVNPPENGDLTGTPPDVIYMPDTGYAGLDSFTFKANDGEDDSNIATVSIAVIGDQGALTDIADYSNAGIDWEKALFEDLDISGDDLIDMPFGIALPSGYNPAEATKYPLVLYLHGAAARGTDGNQQLRRETALFFASWEAATDPVEWNAFVLAPQCPSSDRWVERNWDSGPYIQNDGTYGEYLHLTENLLHYMIDSANNGPLFSVLGLEADDIDANRIYVVGDSMGAYGTWDIVARQPGFFAGAIASGGSGPKNKLDELRMTPFWAIHGEGDRTVPNYLPTGGDPDGAGSLGMLALLDPTFGVGGIVSSSDLVYVDNPELPNDDPEEDWTDFIYSEFPGAGHTPAKTWTVEPTYGVREWLFAQTLTPATCAGDLSGDGDSDGDDLARLISNFDPAELADFAADFGNFCP